MTKTKQAKPKIVAVDDNLLNLKVIESSLSDFSVTLVSDSTKAIATIESAKPDLLILDILMPDLDGFQLSEAVRAHPEFKDLPILFLSARSDTPSIVRCFQVGGNDYVAKPFVREELLARIHAQLRLKHAEMEHFELQQRMFLNARLSSLSGLTSGMSHEINNPLAIISATIQQLSDILETEHPEAKTAVVQKMFDRLQRSAVRIENVVIALQTYSKQTIIEGEAFTLCELVGQTANLLRGLYLSQGIAFDVEESDKELEIQGSPYNLKFIINSLISNAHEAVLQSKNEKRIRLSIRRKDEFGELVVEDTGCGMTTNHQELLFTPFFTTKDPGQGMGMSLCIAQQLIAQMGGDISIVSEANKGTTVTVRIPARN